MRFRTAGFMPLISCNAKSNTTRIETSGSSPHCPVFSLVATLNPIQQGLKRARRAQSFSRLPRVATLNPIQQGLKHAYRHLCASHGQGCNAKSNTTRIET